MTNIFLYHYKFAVILYGKRAQALGYVSFFVDETHNNYWYYKEGKYVNFDLLAPNHETALYYASQQIELGTTKNLSYEEFFKYNHPEVIILDAPQGIRDLIFCDNLKTVV